MISLCIYEDSAAQVNDACKIRGAKETKIVFGQHIHPDSLDKPAKRLNYKAR